MKFLIALLVLTCLSFPSFALQSVTADSYLTTYSSTNVGTTPVTIVSSAAHIVREVHIFDSSGVGTKITVTSGTYVTTVFVPPGGDNYTLKVSKGDVITLAALSGTISSGVNIITLLY